jgi:RNA polymerase sigma-70 factor, ECF subfamily
MTRMSRYPLAAAYRARAAVAPSEPDAALESALAEYVGAARSRWPELELEELQFVAYVAARARAGQLPPAQHAADLLLAYACSLSQPEALAAFQRELGPVIDRVLIHRRATQDVAADARQIVQERLLVGDASKGTPAKIADYRGAGPLHSWVASSAATTLLTLLRTAQRRREQPEDSAAAAAGVRLDPELDYLKLRYKAPVEEALVEALGQLSSRDGTLLRLSLGERMGIDALGAMYSVNRATAARWLVAARRALVEKTKQILRERLQLSEGECDSIVVLVQSQLDVSIVRRLSEDPSST